ncbi:START domain-containing protein [Prosthecochloris sp. SCSIO W1101]|uniref:START domain-containing protein n=1 Tax=Prosthecochloris sp. SCSIO W1101 TaxID=2992242 RepID=UPI00223DEC88|nr:START domain-containing protein [Prosthecochloris sp. SCSIO W1101]UZJ42471.1 START domain-containing protein [Prosthecochloris sp. SCSIO W1101]
MDIEGARESNWEFRVEHKDIFVYSAKIRDSHILGFKGVVEFPVSLRRLISLFHDTGNYIRWVHQLSSIEVLEKGENLEYVIYQAINTPWPFPKREMVVRTGLDTEGDNGIAVTMKSDPDYIPVRSGNYRIRETYGRWVFEPKENDVVRITFIMYVDPGNDIPPPMSNTAMFEVPFYTLQGLRNLACDRAYNPPYPEEVDDYISIGEG